MNECEKYREMISAMVDGELDHSESERLIKHMSSCAECREMYELFSAVSGSPAWELPKAPEGLHGAIMSGVKNAAAAGKKRKRIRLTRAWAAAAACLVLIVAVVLGLPRVSRGGDNKTSSAFFNGSAEANDYAPAPADAPAAGGSDDSAHDTEAAGQTSPSSDEGAEDGKTPDTPSGAGSVSGANDLSEEPPVPEPEQAEQEPEPTEEPMPDMDIAESIVTVESGGNSVNERLSRDDTFIWLRAVIEGSAAGIDAAKIEIHRSEGKDYEVYLYHEGFQLMGSLTDELDNAVELNRLRDFAVFAEMADSEEA